MLTNHSLKYQSPEDDAGSGGGGDDVQAKIDAAVNAAVAGLKSKNSELLGSLKEAKDRLKAFDGIEPEAVHSIIKRFADDEEAGLIKAGKLDEVLNKRTSRMKADAEKAIKAEQDARTKTEAKAAKLAGKALAGALRDAAIKAGALPEAMEDIILRGRGLWTVNDDGEVVAAEDGEVVLGKDGKTPLTPQEWAESLRETAPHLWPRAQGTNALGSNKGGSGNKVMSQSAFDALGPKDRAKRMADGYSIRPD